MQRVAKRHVHASKMRQAVRLLEGRAGLYRVLPCLACIDSAHMAVWWVWQGTVCMPTPRTPQAVQPPHGRAGQDLYKVLPHVPSPQGGGKRKGAFAIYIEPWHADIFEWLDLRKNHGKEEARARDLFYGLWINDLFMQVSHGRLCALCQMCAAVLNSLWYSDCLLVQVSPGSRW